VWLTYCETHNLLEYFKSAINLKFTFFQFVPDFIHEYKITKPETLEGVIFCYALIWGGIKKRGAILSECHTLLIFKQPLYVVTMKC
jgi:hypothetical protein